MKTIIVNGILLDGTPEMKPQYNKAIFIDGERIERITDTPAKLPRGYKRLDAHGMYVLPGLINVHVHLAGNGKPQKKQRDNTKLVNLLFSNPITAAIAHSMVKNYAKLELLSGVTTIRTVGGLKDLDTRVRDEIRQGKVIGPRIIAANEGISVPHGHMAGSVAIVANNIDEAIAQVVTW